MADGKSAGTDLGLLVLRLALGGVMIYHGYGKVAAEGGLDNFIGFIGSLNLPGGTPQIQAYAALAAEFGGGAMLILGILPRFGALLIGATMVIAATHVHWNNGFPMTFKAPASQVTAWVEKAQAAPAPAADDADEKGADTKEEVAAKAPGEAMVHIPHGYEYNAMLLSMSLCILFAGGGRIGLMGGGRRSAPDDD